MLEKQRISCFSFNVLFILLEIIEAPAHIHNGRPANMGPQLSRATPLERAEPASQLLEPFLPGAQMLAKTLKSSDGLLENQFGLTNILKFRSFNLLTYNHLSTMSHGILQGNFSI